MKLPVSRSAFPNRKDRLSLTRSVIDFIDDDFLALKSPFKQQTKPVIIVKFLLIKIIIFLQRLFKTKLLVENTHAEAVEFSASGRTMLASLLASGLVKSWVSYTAAVNSIRVYSVNLYLGTIYGDEQRVLYKENSLIARGVSRLPSEALNISLAETIERFCMSNWSHNFFMNESLTTLQQKRISHYCHSYIYPKLTIDEHQKFDWVKATDLITNNHIYLPASIVFITHLHIYPEQTVFASCSSSGCAVQNTRNKAIASGLLELFERDAVMMYWLNKLSPKQIDLESLQNREHKEIISSLKEANYSVYLLDFETEYKIPVLATLVIDDLSGAVFFDAASGFDIDKVIDKLMQDALLYTIGLTMPLGDKVVRYDEIKTIEDRRILWRRGLLTGEIDFFTQGLKINLYEYKKTYDIDRHRSDDLKLITNILNEHNTNAYVYDYPQPLAKENGLFAVRVICPALLPIYFDESKKHYNVPRLLSFGKNMGFRVNDITTDEINQIPHPIL